MERDREMERLRQQAAILKKFAKDTLGEECWGLTKESYEKFSHEEILFLFARIFNKIGFDSIKSVSTTYPDVVAVRDGKQKNIELEPTLSSFKHHIVHNDDLSICDYVLCWIDDLESSDELRKTLKENKIQVEELYKYYEMTKVIKPPPKIFVWSRKDLAKLSDMQMKILTAFFKMEKSILNKREIQQAIKEIFREPAGKGLGGPLHGLLGKKKEWLIRRHPRGYQFNKKYKDMVEKALKEFEYI